MSTKKIISLILALALSSTAFYGCSKNKDSSSESESSVSETENSAEESSEESSETEEDEDPGYTVSDLADGIVMNISGHDVTSDEYRYFFMYVKGCLDQGDETYWNDDESGEKLESLKDQTMSYLFNNAAIYKIAEINSIELDESDSARIDKKIADTEQYYSATNDGKKFDEYLKEIYCTPEVYRESYVNKYLEEKIVNELYGKDYRAKHFLNYIAVKYIQIRPVLITQDDFDVFIQTDSTLSYTDEEKAVIEKLNGIADKKDETALNEAVPELMEIIKNRLNEGESFDTLMKKYNMDYTFETKVNGEYAEKYINDYSMQSAFFNVANDLEEDETSDGSLYIDGSGFYIIKRVPFDEEYLREYLIPVFMGDDSYPYASDYSKLCRETTSIMEVTVDTDYESINLDTFK